MHMLTTPQAMTIFRVQGLGFRHRHVLAHGLCMSIGALKCDKQHAANSIVPTATAMYLCICVCTQSVQKEACQIEVEFPKT